MGEIAFTLLDQKFRIHDNGDGRLGEGDTVTLGVEKSAPVSIDDPKVARDLRAAGIELADLRGASIPKLTGFFRAFNAFLWSGIKDVDQKTANMERKAVEAGISWDSTDTQRVLCKVVERKLDSVIRWHPILTKKDFPEVQELASKAGLDIPSGPSNAVTLPYQLSEASMRMAERATDGLAAYHWLYLSRRFAQEAGTAFDIQKAEAILSPFRDQAGCSELEASRARKHSSPCFGYGDLPGLNTGNKLDFRTPTEKFCGDSAEIMGLSMLQYLGRKWHGSIEDFAVE